jgi:hypothetical protein
MRALVTRTNTRRSSRDVTPRETRDAAINRGCARRIRSRYCACRNGT